MPPLPPRGTLPLELLALYPHAITIHLTTMTTRPTTTPRPEDIPQPTWEGYRPATIAWQVAQTSGNQPSVRIQGRAYFICEDDLGADSRATGWFSVISWLDGSRSVLSLNFAPRQATIRRRGDSVSFLATLAVQRTS